MIVHIIVLFAVFFTLPLCVSCVKEARAEEGRERTDRRLVVWQVEDREHEVIKDDCGIMAFTDEGFMISNIKKNFTMAYPISLPKTDEDSLYWHICLQIRNAVGVTMPGIGMGNGSVGFSFLVNPNIPLGSLEIFKDGKTMTIGEFEIPKIEYPCTIGLSYDATKHEIKAFLNGNPVNKATLTGHEIPFVTDINTVSIETSNPCHSALGGALYGNLTVQKQGSA